MKQTLRLKALIIVAVVLALGGVVVYLIMYSNVIENEQTREGELFSWDLDPGIRVSDGTVPYVYTLPNNEYRMYYCGEGGILSAVSSDGLNFTKEDGIRLSGSRAENERMVCDATIIPLPDGSVRMYYKGATGPGGPDQSVHKIFSAVSADGLSFEREGVRIDSETTDDRGWASVPEAVLLPDGRVRIYYVSDSIASGHGIVSVISPDGLTFTKESTVISGFVDPAVTTLPDGKYLLVASVLPHPPSTKKQSVGIYRFISEDGIQFSGPEPVLVGEENIDPSIVDLGNGQYRIYFWNIHDKPSVIKSITGGIVE